MQADAIRAAVDRFASATGGLELVVANAGVTHYGPFGEQPLADALEMSAVNWHGTLFTVQAALPHLLDGGRGHIAVVSSGAGNVSFVAAHNFNPDSSAYITGNKAEAPELLHRTGLEWVYRLLSEPRRLWRRYLFGNAAFVAHALRQLPRSRRAAARVGQ